jgi:hypothetical protein
VLLRLELESAIRELLLLGKDSAAVADRIVERLKEHTAGRSERRAFLNYLIQCGRYQEAYILIGHWMSSRERIPWTEFCYLLKISGYKPSKEFLNYFFKAMDEVDTKDSVEIFQAWSALDERFAVLEQTYLATLRKESEENQRLLFEKLEFFRTNRMVKEEEKLLRDLLLRFPENTELKNSLKSFESRWAHNLISERARNLTEDHWLSEAGKPAKDLTEVAQHLLQVMQEHVSVSQHLAYDFSVGLYVMELYSHAAILIREAPESLASDWFRIEVMLKSRRYLECLEELNEVEIKYAADPETSFAATYLRAQVLHGLGQKGHAVELLKSLVHIRPHYRSASSLITEWEHGR